MQSWHKPTSPFIPITGSLVYAVSRGMISQAMHQRWHCSQLHSLPFGFNFFQFWRPQAMRIASQPRLVLPHCNHGTSLQETLDEFSHGFRASFETLNSLLLWIEKAAGQATFLAWNEKWISHCMHLGWEKQTDRGQSGSWTGKWCSQYVADAAEINRCVFLSTSGRAGFHQKLACV